MSMMLHLDSVEHDLANKGVWVTTRFLELLWQFHLSTFSGWPLGFGRLTTTSFCHHIID